MVKRFVAGIAVMCACAGVAQGETYEWLDDQGVVHFTDNPDKIPGKYRKRVKERASVTGEAQRTPPTQEKPPVEAGGGTPLTPKEELYGGHNKAWWRSSFTSLRNELKGIEERLPAKKEQLVELRHRRTVYQKGRDRVAYNELSTDIARDEARIKELQDKIAVLDADAAKAGVPVEWRQ